MNINAENYVQEKVSKNKLNAAVTFLFFVETERDFDENRNENLRTLLSKVSKVLKRSRWYSLGIFSLMLQAIAFFPPLKSGFTWKVSLNPCRLLSLCPFFYDNILAGEGVYIIEESCRKNFLLLEKSKPIFFFVRSLLEN